MNCRAHIGRSVAVLSLGLLAAGCSAGSTTPISNTAPTTGADADASARRTRTVTTPDGVAVHYTDSGARRLRATRQNGDRLTVILIHGWSLDHTAWERTVARLRDRYRVIAIDLPGHGRSTGGLRQDWSIPSYGSDVAYLMATLHIEHAVLVGHSMGAAVAIEATRHAGGRVLGVVAVDSLHDVSQRWTFEEELLQRWRTDFDGTCRWFASQLLHPDVDPAVLDDTRRRLCSANPKVALSLIESFADYDIAAASACTAAPVRAINGDLFPTNTAVNQQHFPSFKVERLEGVGHFPMLERPEQFATALEGAIEKLLAE